MRWPAPAPGGSTPSTWTSAPLPVAPTSALAAAAAPAFPAAAAPALPTATTPALLAATATAPALSPAPALPLHRLRRINLPAKITPRGIYSTVPFLASS